MGGAVRVVVRATLVFFSLAAMLAHFAALRLLGRPTLLERARWMQCWCRWHLRVLGIEVERNGRAPESGLLVSNHLTYLDILVFGAQAPAVFVAKMEVRSWPVLGLVARLAGSIFTDRARLRQLAEVVAKAQETLAHGALLVAFPEATTTDGTLLLRFRPALFEAAVRTESPVTSAHICYTVEGRFATELCWWGEVRPVRHLLGAFAKRRIQVHLRFANGSHRFCDRKQGAAATQAEVLEMRAHEADHAPALDGVAAAAVFAFGRG